MFRDGFSGSLSALREVYHTLKTVPRTGKPGRPKQPVKEPPPDLVYGQVIKKKRQGRLHRTLRHALAPLVRKSWSFCKDRTQMRRRVVLLQAYYNCARPHMSLRVPLPEQEPHTSGLLQPKWCHHTPGMAAGLTDHVWTFRELLTVKFEPIHNQSNSG